MNPDRTILYEEVERINAERGTNLTVEGILEGWGRKDAKWVARLVGWGSLLVPLIAIAGLGLSIGIASDASAGGRAVFVLIGLIALVLCFFPIRSIWRMLRDWNREIKAIEEMNRRVDARHTAREQGRAE